MRRCIYCVTDKDETAFNREHGLNRAFGTYAGKENERFVLNCVCQECNQLFGDTIDLKFGRDTIEGLWRFMSGIKKAAEFKPFGKSSTTITTLTEGPYRGVRGYLTQDERRGTMFKPIPSVGFAHAEGEPFEWFTLDALPSREQLAAKGYVSGVSRAQTFGDASDEDFATALEAKGLKLLKTHGTPPPRDAVLAESVFTIAHPEFRAATKIALNYVAAVVTPEVVLRPAFDLARRYVRHDEQPIPVGMGLNRRFQDDGERGDWHYLCVGVVDDQIIAQVCLHLKMFYVLTLAQGAVFDGSFGHRFDPVKREVTDMGAALPPDFDAIVREKT